MERLQNILDFDLNKLTDEKLIAKVATEQRQAAGAILALQVRVDESNFRKQSNDKMAEILAEVRAAAGIEAEPEKPAVDWADLV
jgi:hypothetical protein